MEFGVPPVAEGKKFIVFQTQEKGLSRTERVFYLLTVSLHFYLKTRFFPFVLLSMSFLKSPLFPGSLLLQFRVCK